jgi:hypothetical protein
MVAYDFMAEHAPGVESGEKRSTIRKPRKRRARHARPGERLQLYTGQRTPGCRKLGEAVCIEQRRISIHIWSGGTAADGTHTPARLSVILDNMEELTPEQVLRLARADGFDGIPDFVAFFLPRGVRRYDGYLIKWGELLR